MTTTKAAHNFATAALLLPVLVFLHSVSLSHQIEEKAHIVPAQPSPSASEPSMTLLWQGSPPSANGRAPKADDSQESTSRRMATAAAPIYELKHGLGVFSIASGTGCYEGAKGQAQARFGVVTADVDLFVPSVLDMLDEEAGASPQDTVFDVVGGDDDVQRRLDSAVNRTDSHQCDIFHSGKKSFNQISISMERRSSSAEYGRVVQDSSTSHHHHGIFKAKEEWFDGMAGEYSLGCIHHECTMSLFFGIGASSDCEEGSCGNPFASGEKGMTSLKLQGTTELAYQGAGTNMLVCVENCDGVGGVGGSAVNLDAEYVEPIRVRSFDNNVVQVLSSHTKAPKAAKGAGGTKAPKAAKGAGGTKAPKAAKSGKSSKAAATAECVVDADCDDAVACTDNSCTAGTCVFTPNDSNCVDDNLFCNGSEICDANSGCISDGNPCTVSGEKCSEDSDSCVSCATLTGLTASMTCYDTATVSTCSSSGVDTLVVVSTAQQRFDGHSTAAGNIGPGFQLAEPRTDALNECYKAIIDATGPPALYVFGVNDIATEGNFTFNSDGSAVDFGAYSTPPWFTGEPNNSGGVEDCIVYTFDQLWADGNCGRSDYQSIYELL